jgi:hypothetical protein
VIWRAVKTMTVRGSVPWFYFYDDFSRVLSVNLYRSQTMYVPRTPYRP